MKPMLLNDKAILELCKNGMIDPFESKLQRLCYSMPPVKAISYGLSSFGYDISLAKDEFKVFNHVPGLIVDPKDFDNRCLVNGELHTDLSGQYFILPGNSYALALSKETFSIPKNVLGICFGKSTYARVGVSVNITPLEPGWKGKLVIEIANNAKSDVKIYANEGIAQLIFIQSEKPETTYSDRQGKYQNQSSVTFAKV